jgi:SulP family sulfate permease
MVVLWALTVVDFGLQIQGLRHTLLAEVKVNYELRVYGVANFITAFFIGTPGYLNVKFASINAHINHNTKDRTPLLVIAVLMLLALFTPHDYIDFIPRFTFASFLFFGGLGFAVEHLFVSYRHLSLIEFLAVWVVLILAIFTNLVIATAVSVGLAALVFVVHAGRQHVIAKGDLLGADRPSLVVRSPREAVILNRLGTRVCIIRLQHNIFFGSVNQIKTHAHQLLKHEREHVPPERRFRFIVFDFDDVEGIDSTAADALHEIIVQLHDNDCAWLRSLL